MLNLLLIQRSANGEVPFVILIKGDAAGYLGHYQGGLRRQVIISGGAIDAVKNKLSHALLLPL